MLWFPDCFPFSRTLRHGGLACISWWSSSRLMSMASMAERSAAAVARCKRAPLHCSWVCPTSGRARFDLLRSLHHVRLCFLLLLVVFLIFFTDFGGYVCYFLEVWLGHLDALRRRGHCGLPSRTSWACSSWWSRARACMANLAAYLGTFLRVVA